ncbi:hypothetical protein PQR01_40065 [Paraburkholderia rhynchosiae]|uniref:Uncharacterized protein n=1 Tax=Paraburkholderia rhynchosiae TaxID=487049 RepID=A0ACC7NQV2_9BURK
MKVVALFEFFRIAKQPVGALRVESERRAVGNLAAEVRQTLALLIA